MTATATRRKPPENSAGNGRRRESADGPPRRNGYARPFDEAVLKKIVSNSPLMDEVFLSVRRVAAVESTVLVTGESGTGKELIATAIHTARPFP